MQWIENVSKDHANRGIHYDTCGKGVLISITDPCSSEVQPVHKFQEIHRFEFLDTEDPEDEFGITDEQAASIASILRAAYESGQNVVVNCHAGISRSSAVVECGLVIGFSEICKPRLPNLLVKQKIFSALGMNYDPTVDINKRNAILGQSEWD